MNVERDDWTPDGAVVASDGLPVRAHDDVFLVAPVAVESQGSGRPWNTVPSGRQATVLFFTKNAPVELDLECHMDGGFCFARTTADNVRFAMTIEEKYPR